MKFWGKPNGDKEKKKAKAVAKAQLGAEGPGNAAMVEKSGAGEKKKGGWLSRAWGGVKSVGSSMLDGLKEMGASAKAGAVTGAGLGALPGLALGGAIGGGLGALSGEKSKAAKGAAIGGGILAIPGALVGGLIGAVGGMMSRGIEELTTDEEELLEKTADIPAYHVMMEQLAHTYAYGKGDMKTLEAWGYEITAEHEDKNSGFRVIGLTPISKGAKDPDGNPLKPVLAFRGTANSGGAKDDANEEGIGTFQFSRNEKEVQNVFAQAGSPADVTGHSLGGALAQLAAARLGGLVSNIVTFQSPGISKAEASKIDPDKHKATHYRAGGDLVSDAGEAFAKGEVFSFDHKGPDSPLSHMTFPLAELNALRKKHNMDKPIVEGARSTDDEWVAAEPGKAQRNAHGVLIEDEGHHQGHWKDDKAQTQSRLSGVDHSKDSTEAGTTTLTSVAGMFLGGGRSLAEGARKIAGDMSGIADQQTNYAAAWKEIRGLASSVTAPSQIPGVRAKIVDVVIKHGVEPMDHGKFISQAEAAMIDALEASPLNATGSTATA